MIGQAHEDRRSSDTPRSPRQAAGPAVDPGVDALPPPENTHHRRPRQSGARRDDPDLPGQLSRDAWLGGVPGVGMLYRNRLRLAPAAGRYCGLVVLTISS